MTPHSETSYGTVAKLLHWLMALMIFVLLAVGSYLTSLESTDPTRGMLLGMHKSFGSLFMLLAIIRVIWSRVNRGPALPDALAAWERLLSQLVSASLYVLMLAIPLSGYAMSNLFGYPVGVFGLVELPILFDKNPALGQLAKQAHVLLGYALVAALVAHIAGALKHRFLDAPEADVLPRMLPLKRRL